MINRGRSTTRTDGHDSCTLRACVRACVRAYVSHHITKQMRPDVGPTPTVGPPKYLHDSHAHSSGRSVASRVKGSRAGRAGASTEVPLWRDPLV